MIYDIDSLKRAIKPVADKYELEAVYLFGSYARNEAGDKSDIDLLFTMKDQIPGLTFIGCLKHDLTLCLNKDVDIFFVKDINDEKYNRIRNEIIKIY